MGVQRIIDFAVLIARFVILLFTEELRGRSPYNRVSWPPIPYGRPVPISEAYGGGNGGNLFGPYKRLISFPLATNEKLTKTMTKRANPLR